MADRQTALDEQLAAGGVFLDRLHVDADGGRHVGVDGENAIGDHVGRVPHRLAVVDDDLLADVGCRPSAVRQALGAEEMRGGALVGVLAGAVRFAFAHGDAARAGHPARCARRGKESVRAHSATSSN